MMIEYVMSLPTAGGTHEGTISGVALGQSRRPRRKVLSEAAIHSSIEKDIAMNAESRGNIDRSINHSSDPNSFADFVNVKSSELLFIYISWNVPVVSNSKEASQVLKLTLNVFEVKLGSPKRRTLRYHRS